MLVILIVYFIQKLLSSEIPILPCETFSFAVFAAFNMEMVSLKLSLYIIYTNILHICNNHKIRSM